MFIYGRRASKIGNFNIRNAPCTNCNQEIGQSITVFGKYAHIFWIPLFPMGKTPVAECIYCKRTIPKEEFTPALLQAYEDIKPEIKRPKRHWFGIGLVGLFVAFTTFVGVTAEVDPRDDLLKADMEQMNSNPTMETDSISYKMKLLFDNFATEEMNPGEFEYFTKIEDDKALILVQIPELRKVEKEARGEALEMVQMVTDSQTDLEGLDKYIGIQGLATMLIIKTPTYEKNSKLALTSELYDFYGPKPIVEEQ